MYRSKQHQQLEFSDFYLPFSGYLDPENRWIQLARLVPWPLVEEIYHEDLCEDFGAQIVPSRTALGALLVKERLGLTDRETVEALQENPYLQFFIGLEEFTQEKPFDASLMVAHNRLLGGSVLEKPGCSELPRRLPWLLYRKPPRRRQIKQRRQITTTKAKTPTRIRQQPLPTVAS